MTKETAAKTMTIRGLEIAIGDKPVKALIGKVVSASAAYRALLHTALVSTVIHAVETHDTTLITNLFDGTGNETNKAKGIATWLRAHTSLDYRDNGKGMKMWLKPKDQPNVLLFNVDDSGNAIRDDKNKRIPVIAADWNGIDVPFYDMAQVAKDNEVPSLGKAFDILFAKFGKMIEKGTLPEADKALYDYAKDAVSAFKIAHLAPAATAAAATAVH